MLRVTVELESKKHPAFPKKQNDVILILCKHLVPWKCSVKGYKTGCQKVKHRLGPVKAGLTCPLSLSLSLSLADSVHPEGTPWILPRLDPGRYWSTEWAHFFSMIRHMCPTTHHTTSTSQVKRIGLQSLASSTIFTWSLANRLPLLQASWQLFAEKMLPQPAGGRKCFPRVCQILKHGFFYATETNKLISHWQKCVDCNGSYFN